MKACHHHAMLLIYASLVVCLSVGVHAAQSPKPESRFTVEEVIKLSQAGFADDLIITKIKKNGKAFDLSADELLELKKAGLSDTVVRFLLDPTQPYSPPPPVAPPAAPPPAAAEATPPPPAPPAKQYPEDPHASKISADPGLYYILDDEVAKVDIKVLLGAKQSAGLGKVVLKKGKVVAYLVGAAAKTRMKAPKPVFYFRLAEGKGIEEVVLLALKSEDGRRGLTLGPPKQEINADDTREFEALEVAARLFRIRTSVTEKGEYVFFLLGSAEPPKGSQGKGYDFGIDLAQPKK